jgi:prephenate dehydrogenase
MKKVGLIGFGRFGKLLNQQISKTVSVNVHDPWQAQNAEYRNIPFCDLSEVCANELLIVAVPVSAISELSRSIARYLKPNTTVMDVCAVKKYPLQVLEKNLPENIYLLGSHPLFGPDSVQDSLQDHIMILTPYRIPANRVADLKKFWTGFGIKIVEMTADEQDRLMAWSLALTHFLGRGLHDLPLPDTAVSTRDFQHLIQLTKKINLDTWELFEDMHHFNPYTKEMRRLLLEAMQSLKEKLDQISDSNVQTG